MSRDKATRELTLRLCASHELGTEGMGVLGPAGIKGRVALEAVPGADTGGAKTRVALRLATDWEAPIASVRWLVDQVIRRTRRLFDLNGCAVELESQTPAIPQALEAALKLDLRRAFGARRPETGAGVALDDPRDERYASHEELFRAWVNEDPATRTSLAIAAEVEALRQLPDALGLNGEIEVEILDAEALTREGLNLLLAVGQAAEVSPPRLALARWIPRDAADHPPLVLLGKGITFDTGGINVKPYESFVSHMRNDMAGAALAFAAFRYLVQGGFPRPLVLAIPACENAIGERAMRPGTVVKSYRGHRVKIDHTDAEGRLILADALAYAEDRFAPELTLCFATLTTAALQAYGPHATPVHFASGPIADALMAASQATGEDLHLLPARPWHFEANRDDEADLKNTARLTGYMPAAAGSRNAAHFLMHFARRPLVHFDIFASTWNWGGDHPGTGYGATGAPLRTFLLALERFAGA